MGTGVAQALLPRLQFRTASGGHGQWLEYRARRAAQLSAGGRFSVPAFGDDASDPGTSGAGSTDLSNSLALGCDQSPRSATFSRRQESAAADSAHALGRSAGLGFS